jgi:hypothetical protein
MSHWKAFGLAIFAAACLLGETTGSARAQCIAGNPCATEWSRGSAIPIEGLPDSNESQAYGINERRAGGRIQRCRRARLPYRVEPRERHPASTSCSFNCERKLSGSTFAQSSDVTKPFGNHSYISSEFVVGLNASTSC